MVFSVLAVCEGNYCRSPLVERLLAHRLDELGVGAEFSVASAGVRALVGYPVEQHAAAELARLGGSGEGFVSRQLEPAMVDGAGLVLVATRWLRAATLDEAPRALRRTFTLRELAELAPLVGAEGQAGDTGPAGLVARWAAQQSAVDVGEYDLADPIGMDAAFHRTVADVADAAVSVIARELAASLG